MKKWMVAFLLLFCMTGCGQKEVPIEYITEWMKEVPYGKITVDENGILYTVEYEQNAQCITIYDSNGVLLEEKVLPTSTGIASLVEASKDVLYLIVPEVNCNQVLYEIDTTIWQAKRLYDFYEFDRIEQIVPIGKDIYVLGILKNPFRIQYEKNADGPTYVYSGQAVVKLVTNAKVPELEYVPIAFPQEIFKFGEDGLGIYCNTLENASVLYEYKEGNLQQKRQLANNTYSDFRNCGEGFLYIKNYERVCYGTMDEDAETDIMIASNTWGYSTLWMSYRDGFTATGTYGLEHLWITYKDGYFYWQEKGQELQRISMENIVKENNTLQVLGSSWIDEGDIPHSCGYKMKKQTLCANEFAQEVLEQDTEFDLYLLSSREHISYELKENGEFYPLNEVEGVQEYLDACFPYVKEAAINDEGEIWMIPVTLTIPGLVYNKQFCAENGVDFTQMDLAEFIDFTAEIRAENVNHGSVSGLVLRETLFGQYMTKYDTFDTALLREYVQQFKDVKARYWGLSYSASSEATNNLRTGRTELPNFYYNCFVYQWSRDLYLNSIGDSDYFGVVPIPTIEENLKNMGTVTFMMVNPNSENLEDTLQYISDYAKYALTVKDSFILADESTYTDTPIVKDCYELYANGGIFFEMNNAVYVDAFNEYLDGTMELEEMMTKIENQWQTYLEQ